MPIQRAAEKTAEKTFIRLQYPVKPGETRFDVSYALPPPTRSRARFFTATESTRLVTPATVTLEGEGIESLGQEPQTKAHIYNAGQRAYSSEDRRHRLAAQRRKRAAPDEDAGQPQIEEEAGASLLADVLGAGLGIRDSGPGRRDAVSPERGISAAA